MAVAMLMMDASSVGVATPYLAIQRTLHWDVTYMRWAVGASALAMAAFSLGAGCLADHVGRRRMFLGGVLVFGFASLMCGLADSEGHMIEARLVQGLAGAVLFSTGLALVGQCYQGRARRVAFGIHGAVTGAAGVLGPLLGDSLSDGPGWRWIFFVNLPLSALILALAWWSLPRSEGLTRHSRWDIGGMVTVTVGLVLVTVALLRGGEDGWSSMPAVLLFAGAAASLALFLFIEARHPRPMLDPRLFRDVTFSGAQLATVAMYGSVFALMESISLYLGGYGLLGVGVPLLLVGAVASSFIDRLPPRVLPATGLALISAGLLLLIVATAAAGSVVIGIGLGLALPALRQLSMQVADGPRLGVFSGVNITCGQVAIFAGSAAYNAILGRYGIFGPLHLVLVIAAVLAAVGAVVALVLIRQRVPTNAAASPPELVSS